MSMHDKPPMSFLGDLFGLQVGYESDTCVISAPVRPEMCNVQGALHGGVISFILDVSMGYLLLHTRGTGVTLEMKTQFMLAVRNGPIRAEARFLKAGRKMNFLESRLFDATGVLAAMATATWRVQPEL